MHRRTPTSSTLVTALLVTSCCFLVRPGLTFGQVPAPPPADTAGQAFQALMEGYYEAYARKDLAAMADAWHPNGPARSGRNVFEMEFELRDTVFKALRLSGVAVDASGGRARAVIDMATTDRKTGRSRAERRVRDLTFLQDGGTWKLWNEASVGIPLANRILSAPEAERTALLSSEPELLSDDALAGLAREGLRLRTEGQLGKVGDVLRLRLEIARATGNDLVAANCLLDTGLLLQITGRIPEAGRAFTEARALFAAAGTPGDVAMLDMNLASVDYLEGRYATALERYEQALRFFEAAKNVALVASTRHSIGNTLYMLGEFERSLESYKASLSISEETGNKHGAAAVHLAIALVHKDLGNFGLAAEAYRECAALSEGVGDTNGAAKAFHGLGEIHRLQGDFALALESFQSSLARWEKTPDVPHRAATMFSVGQVYAQQRSFALAAEWYKRALDLDQSIGEEQGIARDLGGLGGARFALGDADTALAHYEKSLALREKNADHEGVVWTLIHMGVLHASQARPDEAVKVCLRAIGGASTLGDRAALATARALTASARLAAEDVEGALESSALAADLALQVERYDVLAFARTVAGKAHRLAERPDEARSAFEEAVAALDRIPVGPGTDTFFDDRRSPYLALIDLLVSQNRHAEAYAWLERGRQHALAVMLGGDGSLVVRGLSPEERDEERGLVRKIRTASVKLARERARSRPDESRRVALQEELSSLRSQLDSTRQRFFAAHPRLSVLRAQQKDVDLEEAGRSIGPHDAVLAFSVGEARTHVFVLASVPAETPTDTPSTRIDVATIEGKAIELAGSVARFRQLLTGRDDGVGVASRELHGKFLAPVQTWIAHKTHLIVIPDVFLWNVPFEALLSQSGRYVVEDAAVSYTPSLSALGVHSAVAGLAQERTLTVLAAPAIPNAAVERMVLLRPGFKLDRADAGQREARSVAALFGAARSTVVTGAAATADRIASGVPSGGVLHVSAPLVLSDASPLYSPLLLSPSRAEDRSAGLVEVGAVMGWEVPAGLAVLSSADSGPGAVTGEALTGLSWAMMVAGTPTVAASRWTRAALAGPVRPDPLLANFYRALVRAPAAGKAAPSPATALQQAARRMLAVPSTRHPADWARIMIVGR